MAPKVPINMLPAEPTDKQAIQTLCASDDELNNKTYNLKIIPITAILVTIAKYAVTRVLAP